MIKKTMLILPVLLLIMYALGVTVTGSVNPLDVAKAIEIRAMGIKPGEPFYESTRRTVGRIFRPFHNYPEYAPITVEQAENAPHRVYSPETSVRIATVGDNYQYQEQWSYGRKPQYILLNQAQLDSIKDIENGVHFFILDEALQLQPLPDAKAALDQHNYIKIIKQMGKLISIEKKPLVGITKWEYEYWDKTGEIHYLNSFSYDIDGTTILWAMLVEYDENSNAKSIIIKDGQGNILSMQTVYPQGEKYYSEEVFFNREGIKTNIIYYSYNSTVENHHLDENGNVIQVTNDRMPDQRPADFTESERYQSLVVDTSKKFKSVGNLEPEK
jgi:hypothetical protein